MRREVHFDKFALGGHFFLDAVFEEVKCKGVVILVDSGHRLFGVDVFQRLKEPISSKLLILDCDRFLNFLVAIKGRHSLILILLHIQNVNKFIPKAQGLKTILDKQIRQ